MGWGLSPTLSPLISMGVAQKSEKKLRSEKKFTAYSGSARLTKDEESRFGPFRVSPLSSWVTPGDRKGGVVSSTVPLEERPTKDREGPRG